MPNIGSEAGIDPNDLLKKYSNDGLLDKFLNIFKLPKDYILQDEKSSGMIGPNLDELRSHKIRIVDVVTNGIGVMPAFQGILSSEEIEAVAHYVSAAVGN